MGEPGFIVLYIVPRRRVTSRWRLASREREQSNRLRLQLFLRTREHDLLIVQSRR